MSSSRLSRQDFISSLSGALQTKSQGFELQDRDYQILRFILEQKFCSLEALYFRFFDVRKAETDPLPKNFWTTRQRLSRLRTAALIKTEKVLSSGCAHFLITAFGHKILNQHVPDVLPIKPTKEIDFSLYEHDSRITMIRALTEAKKKSIRWYSEKWLKASPVYIDGKYKYHFAKDIRPDAFFINSKGEKLAFELEMARKSRSRLEEKIREYDNLLELKRHYTDAGHGPEFRVVDKVWFVTTKPAVLRHLRAAIEKISNRAECFRVDLYDEVVAEYARVVRRKD